MEICYKTFVVYSEDQVNVQLVNSQQTLPVYSEDIVDNYSYISTSVQDLVVDISLFQEFLEKETVLSNHSSINVEEFNSKPGLPYFVVVSTINLFLANLDIMEEKKEEIATKWREVTAQMRAFPIKKLKVNNYKARYQVVSDKIETLLTNLLILYYELFDKIVD